MRIVDCEWMFPMVDGHGAIIRTPAYPYGPNVVELMKNVIVFHAAHPWLELQEVLVGQRQLLAMSRVYGNRRGRSMKIIKMIDGIPLHQVTGVESAFSLVFRR